MEDQESQIQIQNKNIDDLGIDQANWERVVDSIVSQEVKKHNYKKITETVLNKIESIDAVLSKIDEIIEEYVEEEKKSEQQLVRLKMTGFPSYKYAKICQKRAKNLESKVPFYNLVIKLLKYVTLNSLEIIDELNNNNDTMIRLESRLEAKEFAINLLKEEKIELKERIKELESKLSSQTTQREPKVDTNIGDLIKNKSKERTNESIPETTRDKVKIMLSEGKSQADIVRELGLSKQTISEHVQKLRESGQVPDQTD